MWKQPASATHTPQWLIKVNSSGCFTAVDHFPFSIKCEWVENCSVSEMEITYSYHDCASFDSGTLQARRSTCFDCGFCASTTTYAHTQYQSVFAPMVYARCIFLPFSSFHSILLLLILTLTSLNVCIIITLSRILWQKKFETCASFHQKMNSNNRLDRNVCRYHALSISNIEHRVLNDAHAVHTYLHLCHILARRTSWKGYSKRNNSHTHFC